MSIPWSLPVFVAATGALVVVRAFGRRLFTGTVPRRRSFWCPFRERNVQADFSESAWDGCYIDVQACDAFMPPTEVGCDKACLDMKRLPATRTQPPEPPARSWVW